MKFTRLLPLIAAGLLLGCNGDNSGSSAPTTTNGEKPAADGKKTLKVALLTPGPISDAGWSALAYEGLQGVKTELGAEVQNQEATGPKIKDAMKAYANQGYDLIFGHGYEYNEVGVALAKDFPKTVFISSSGGGTAPNAGAFRFGLEESFYVAGAMAAKMSKSHVLGMVGGPNVPSIESTLKAFEAGAKSVDPKVVVKKTYTNQNADIPAAKNATLAMIAEGADFIIHQANAAAQGVFDACKEKNVYAFGSNADQNANPSGIVIASAVISAKPAFIALAKDVQAGTYKGSVKTVTWKDGAIDYVINPKLADKVPADVKTFVDDLIAKIKSGAVTVPMDKF